MNDAIYIAIKGSLFARDQSPGIPPGFRTFRNPRSGVNRTRKTVFGRPQLPGVISEESYMRIRVSGRFIAVWAILAVFLCLLPASTKTAVARPIGWEDVGPPQPDPKGDNDGVVLKSRSAGPTLEAAGKMGVTESAPSLRSARSDFSALRLYFTVTRLNYLLFWLR